MNTGKKTIRIISDIKYDENAVHSSWICPKHCPFSDYRYGEFGFQMCQLNYHNTQLKRNKTLKRYERSQQCKASEANFRFLQNYHHSTISKLKIQHIKMTTPHKLGDVINRRVLGFKDEYGFLSNFYPCIVEYEGISYPSVQHAYQAAKTFNNLERNKIKELKTGAEAKKAGNGLEIRLDWQYIKYEIMNQLVYYKFANDFELSGRLLQTLEMQLLQCNTWNDKYWGVVYNSDSEEYIGKNALGIILMDVRKIIYKSGWL